MRKDPIVEEVRKHRQQIAAEFGYDIRAIAQDARRRQASSGHPIVTQQESRKHRHRPLRKASPGKAKA
jgi:hypothetical protein